MHRWARTGSGMSVMALYEMPMGSQRSLKQGSKNSPMPKIKLGPETTKSLDILDARSPGPSSRHRSPKTSNEEEYAEYAEPETETRSARPLKVSRMKIEDTVDNLCLHPLRF